MLVIPTVGRNLLSALRPQDVFATSLYTGTGAAQSITTGFAPDLAWEKTRSSSGPHVLFDRLRGGGLTLDTSTTAAQAGSSSTNASVQANGYNSVIFPAGTTVAGWSFRRAAKFFDIVTYTGDGTSGRVIPHGLGIKPGMIIVKRRDTASISTGGWFVYHQSLGATKGLLLNGTNAVFNATVWNSTEPTAANFTLDNYSDVNAAGGTYVAYLFAHDPDTNGIVQCGTIPSFTTRTAPWAFQYALYKRVDGVGDWQIADAARGFSATANTVALYPNKNDPETGDATGFGVQSGNSRAFFIRGDGTTNQTFVYMLIRAPIT